MKKINPMIMMAGVVALAVVTVFGLSQMGGRSSSSGVASSKGSSLVGGAFSLIDHTGKRVTEKNYRGKYQLVYFGYTHCPEICPTSLQAMSEAMEALGEQGDQIVPLFITVDPERDKPAALADYISNFDPRIVGLTGTPEEIHKASKNYRVYSKKVISKDATDFDHSAITFFMDKQGRYLTHFAYGVDGLTMAKRIKALLQKSEPRKLSKAKTVKSND